MEIEKEKGFSNEDEKGSRQLDRQFAVNLPVRNLGLDNDIVQNR